MTSRFRQRNDSIMIASPYCTSRLSTVSDGNLRTIFQKHLPEAHWQPVETLVGRGIPDVEYCFPGGITGWIENKLTNGWTVDISPNQIAWAERRVRVGGRVFLAVRRQTNAGPRRGAATDELWLFNGSQSRQVSLTGLKAPIQPIGCWPSGPSRWNWEAIRKILQHH